MKTFILIWTALLASHLSLAQLTVENCQAKAHANYPLVRQYQLIEQAEAYNLSNAGKGYLPQVSFTAKASYQSEVTKLPIQLPGIEIESLSKDQYQALLEVNQSIWDGGVIHSQQKSARASSMVQKQKLEVDLYVLNERVNQLFFGILLLEEQIRQNELLQDELKRNNNQISSYITNGIANQADLDAVKVNQLNTLQHRTELEATRKAYRKMLSALIGETIGETTPLIKPQPEGRPLSGPINRPELHLLEAQFNLLETQKNMLAARNRPKFGGFIQGGYANPALNMLKNEFSPYYLAGLRLSWNFGGFYTRKNDSRLLENSQQDLNVQRETFLFNTHLQTTQEEIEIEKIRTQMRHDDEIIRLRNNIKKSAEVKVKNGTLSVTELLREINAENLARQDKTVHEIQLLMAIYQLKYSTNH